LNAAVRHKRLAGYDWSDVFSNARESQRDGMIAAQIEFPLTVAVCAWCKPGNQATGAGTLSHGICLKHLRKLKLQARGISPRRATRSPRKDPVAVDPLLAL